MKHKIEYTNEFGLMMTIENGLRRVYQDVADEDYTWINVKIDRTIALFIDLKTNKVSYNTIEKLISKDELIPMPFQF